MPKNKSRTKHKSSDKVIPLFPEQENAEGTTKNIHIEGFPALQVTVFKDHTQAMFYLLGQIVEAQNAAFDECLRRLLGHLAENEDVRDVMKTWERHWEAIDEQLADYYNILKQRNEQ